MTPIEHKLPSGTMLIVPVPSEAKKFKLVNYPRAGLYLKQTDSKELNGFDCKIPQGFELLGDSKSLTEQQLSGIGLDIESFASLKQMLGIVDENKLNPPIERLNYGGGYSMRQSEVDEYELEQSKVRNYIILFKTS